MIRYQILDVRFRNSMQQNVQSYIRRRLIYALALFVLQLAVIQLVDVSPAMEPPLSQLSVDPL
jgi:hypothetical protein